MDGVGKRPHEIRIHIPIFMTTPMLCTMTGWFCWQFHPKSPQQPQLLQHYQELQWRSAAGRVRLSQRGVAYHSWSTRRLTLRIPGWPLSTVMFPPIKVVGGGHENLGLGAYGPLLPWHQGSQGTREPLACTVSSSLLAGQDSSRVVTWSCSGTRTMFILWVKGVIHPLLMM